MIYLDIDGTIDHVSVIREPKREGAKFIQSFVIRQFGNTNQTTGQRYNDQHYEVKIFRPHIDDIRKLPIQKGKVVRCKCALYGNEFSTDKGMAYSLNLMVNSIEEIS